MIVRIITWPESILANYEELDSSPTERMVHNNFEAVRRLKTAWSTAENLAIALIGRTEPAMPVPIQWHGQTILEESMRYYLPHYYPHTYWGILACQEVSIEPFGKTGAATSRMTSYEHAIITATYRAVPAYYIDALQDEELHPAAEYLTYSKEILHWVPADYQTEATKVAADSAPNKIVYLAEWTYTAKMTPAVSPLASSCIGFINLYAITSPKYGITFPAETLLYVGPEIEEEQTMLSEYRWTVRYKFMYRPEGWNCFYRPGYLVAQYVFVEGFYEPLTVYRLADLSPLLLWEV